ncbi:MAG TPA: hypothetical protein VGI50_11000 [Solirubrobacteraceae bacterium]|jgi:hypothetical protein
MNDESRESLRGIERRLSQASDAAERLIAEAARATRRDGPPQAGWEAPPAEKSGSGRPGELELLISGLRLLAELVPPEVLERLSAALRELLLALRALIDVYVDRLDRPRPERGGVQDIPID